MDSYCLISCNATDVCYNHREAKFTGRWRISQPSYNEFADLEKIYFSEKFDEIIRTLVRNN
jgi:hypothetical protein